MGKLSRAKNQYLLLLSIPNNKETKFLVTLEFRPAQSSALFRPKIARTRVGLEKIGYLPLQTMGFAKLPSKRLTSQNCHSKHVYIDFLVILPI